MTVGKYRFDGCVAIITGAGGGLGRAYALLLASNGAAVVVNDLGATRAGSGSSSSAADAVVAEIRKNGGKAVADYNSVVTSGHSIVKTAIDNFGRLDILINNAGNLRDKTFGKMAEEDWDVVIGVHLKGAYSVTKAAWDVFQRQRYGRILMTSSAAGLYGNYGQANYSAAKMALVGFSNSLAKEGANKNIYCNTIVPLAASRMTESVLPADILEKLKPEFIAPVAAFLCHEKCMENGGLFELGAGFVSKVCNQRAPGLLVKVDDPQHFTPGGIQSEWKFVGKFDGSSSNPTSITEVDWASLVKKSLHLAGSNGSCPNLNFRGKVVLITGAGSGLGKSHALMFAKHGASVVVNDLSKTAAEAVVNEIKTLHKVDAVVDCNSVENGDAVVNTAILKFGRLDVVVNNAGILRDKSFAKMSENEWDLVVKIHLKGTFLVSKAAWPHLAKTKGKIINTTSAVGLYGNFGQTNYSAGIKGCFEEFLLISIAKAGIIGLTKTLAIEGKRNGIMVNAIAPNAGTAMTATIMPKEMVDLLKTDYVSPFLGFLAHESCTESGSVYEVGSGWAAQVRWQRSKGIHLKSFSVDEVAQHWNDIISMTRGTSFPKSAEESFAVIIRGDDTNDGSTSKSSSQESLHKFDFSSKDVILYALGVNSNPQSLNWVYENEPNFKPLSTFGVIPAFNVMMQLPLTDYLPDFNPMMLLHGEQSLTLYKRLPTNGCFSSEAKVVEVSEKPKGTTVAIQVVSKDAKTGEKLVLNESILFIRGIKPKKTLSRTTTNETVPIPTNMKPDFVLCDVVPKNAAALYRLSGDYNPLHIDTAMAKMGGFAQPILHGLCTFGIAGRSIQESFKNENLKFIKGRFSKHVFPGETLITEIFKVDESGKVSFQVKVKERDEIVLSHGFAIVDFSSVKSESAVVKQEKSEESFVDTLFSKIQSKWSNIPKHQQKETASKVKSSFLFEIHDANKSVKYLTMNFKSVDNPTIESVKQSSPDITLKMDGNTFEAVASGKMKGQDAFMRGKLKVSGNMMLAMKLDKILKLFQDPSSKL